MKISLLYNFLVILVITCTPSISGCKNSPVPGSETTEVSSRERILINEGWRFMKYNSAEEADNLIYDVRPEVTDERDDRDADSKPTEAVLVEADKDILKPWILPTGNPFLNDPSKHHQRPEGNPGEDFPFVQVNFNDDSWEEVSLPHDWAIKGPFLEGWDAEVGGGMGRLPSHGVAWYRKKITLPESDSDRSIFLDIDGAMSYAMVWVNGKLAGGWPYGYSSFRLDITPYLKMGEENQIAIRLDNPPNSSRWYPGGGLYRNIWLVKTDAVHIGHWGTFVKTPEVSPQWATVDLEFTIDNDTEEEATVEAQTRIYELDDKWNRAGAAIASFEPQVIKIDPENKTTINSSLKLENPRLWGPAPTQIPHMYVAETTLSKNGKVVDQYETRFGIRSLELDANEGVIVNGEPIFLKGVNQHHDLGALGAAWNERAAERQLEKLREMGVNSIRIAHNPPAPEFLDLTDRMGFLVVNEMYDSWELKKTPLDFHLIFKDWHEQDLRALVRRDRNNPSVIMWSTGNEVGEQYTGKEGAELAARLNGIVHEEDPTRPTTASMNYAKPPMEMPKVMEVINLNYQGEGIRNAPEYAHLEGINTPPLYPVFKDAFPDKVIISSENAAAVSSRGTYVFPVTKGISAPVSDETGGDPETNYVSSYELYTAPFGSSADKVFGSIDRHPYVAGGFVWSGWDYLGEPTPYYLARSSYFGIIDLAGFEKDRFYLYQSRWRPDLPMAHILPHWNWPQRRGEVTPVHVFTSGDEAELFLNGNSLGRKKMGEYEYRLRWDEVKYEPGVVRVVAYKNGEKWAEDEVKTTGEPAALQATVDRDKIEADGKDLAFVTVTVTDSEGLPVPTASNTIQFEVEGPGEIIATDNGDPTDMTPFPSHERKAFSGKALVIIRPVAGKQGKLILRAKSPGVEKAQVVIVSQ